MFPNYLYKKILHYIIYFKYEIQELYTFNSTSYNNQFYNINSNEIIQISLVSKQFFDMVSALLYDILNPYNYSFLNSFINKNINRYNNKLIKNRKIKILGVTDSKQETNKTIIKLNLNNRIETGYFKKNYNRFPSNYVFQVQLEFNYLDPVNTSLIEFKNDVYLQLIGMKNGEYTHGRQFEQIVKLKPKSIEYNPNSSMEIFNKPHIDYSILFQIESLQHLYLDGFDHVEPIAISKINNDTTKLETLSVILLLHDMVKQLNSNNPFPGFTFNSCVGDLSGFNDPNKLKDDIPAMVTTLSNNKTIKKLVLKNYCSRENCLSNYDPSKICHYFKTIFESNSSIESLTLVNFDFIDSIIYSGLELNRSIISLELINYVSAPSNRYQSKLNYLFSDYLKSNKIIKNLKFDWFNSVNNLVESLMQYKSNFNNLYSLSIIIRDFNDAIDTNDKTQINNFLDQIISLSLNTIEINISIFIYSNNNTIFKKILNNIIQE